MSKKVTESIVLEYDLFDLPTAQHKAGLAGLVLQIRSMQADDRIELGRIPSIDMTPHSARITFTEKSMQGVFDDLYDSEWTEVFVRSKWAGATPKREVMRPVFDPQSKATKDVKHFVYNIVLPKMPFLARKMEADDPWLKLWRAMIWTIPRGINTTRAPFVDCAEGRHCSEGVNAWTEIGKYVVGRERNQHRTAPISSAIMLGAQAVNAEGVPFYGRIDQNLLLHFWQVVVLTYVPQRLDDDGKLEPEGFVLAIPEVADLDDFCSTFPKVVDSLDRSTRGFRPAEALIDVPVQANLEFLKHLLDLAASRTKGRPIEYSVSAIESFHMKKEGNTIKLLAHDRVADHPNLVEAYKRIQNDFRNPLFRAATLRALLRDEPWYAEMSGLFAERPWPFFVHDDATPKYIPRFGTDAREKFRAIYRDLKVQKGVPMTSVTDRLSDIVQRLVTNYVEGRAKSKTGTDIKEKRALAKTGKDLKDDRFKRSKDGKLYYDPDDDFREVWKRICSQAFLDMRSRHDQDFVDYFVGTICYVPQYFGNTKSATGDFRFLMEILMRKSDPGSLARPEPCWEDVKALAMVAISACSFQYRPREKTNQGRDA
jgi:CRISPR-associated protein Cmx8